MTTKTSAHRLSWGAPSLRDVVQSAGRHDVANSLDLNGILWLEHINLVVGSSREEAEYFYVDFLGCTRDASSSFHVNLGQQQFHLATCSEKAGPTQIVAGSLGIVVPSLASLKDRIAEAQERFEGTEFAILSEHNDDDDDDDDASTWLSLKDPWGNLFHVYDASTSDTATTAATKSTRKMENLHSEGGTYGPQRIALRGGNPGIRYLEITCPVGSSHSIARFYKEMLGCSVYQEKEAAVTVVSVGPGVHVCFVERDDDARSSMMEGVHICIYAHEFEKLYHRLAARNLVWTNPRFLHLDSCDTWEEAKASRTLRFKDVVDLETGQTILELEHETRPARHGQFLKVPFYEPR